MAINLTNADSALKSVYLDAISEQLDTSASPFMAAIEKTSNHVWGKEVKMNVVHGFNGGVGAGNEDGSLPRANANGYAELTATLKNLYGVIEISDKAVRASENNAGAFVNVLNTEMEGLINSSKFNLGRMLFGNGDGVVATVTSASGGIYVSSVSGLYEGMLIDFLQPDGTPIEKGRARRIVSIDRGDRKFSIAGETLTYEDIPFGTLVTMQGSYGQEITGLSAIFDANIDTIYGLKKSENSFLNPYICEEAGDFTENTIQIALDSIEEASGSRPNFIICSWGVRRTLQKILSATHRTLDTMELAGGYTAMSYNGIPIVVDRFCPKYTMYLLNTEDFRLHQLCDWQWLADDDGRVLKQIPGKPVYTATLVKYAELICSRPIGQGVLKGIEEE